MDFNSLSVGSTFYVLREGGDKPTLHIGTVKMKQPQMPTNICIPNNNPQLLTLTAQIDGKDVVYTDVPASIEIAQKGNDTFTARKELILNAIESMTQRAEKTLSMIDYYRCVKDEGEQMRELLDVQYAEDKRQARTIKALEERQLATDKKLDSILSILTKKETK